jgi:mono/diheme cytochrome c family protein
MKKVQNWKKARKISALAGGIVMALGLQSAQAQDAAISYNTHVAKILNENCVVCHQAGGIGPMQLSTYEQVRPWAPLIQMRVANREMPPYAYDHGIGIQDLQADWRLDQDEIDTVVAWVNAGSPLGDPDIVPPSPEIRDAKEWNFAAQFGQPDLIIPSTPLDIPANGNDMWSKEYVASGLTEDRCIKAIQVKPRGDAAAVVHHANSSVYTENEFGELERYGQLTEYAMGKWGEVPSDGVCRTLPANSQVLWDIHMFPGGVGATAEAR